MTIRPYLIFTLIVLAGISKLPGSEANASEPASPHLNALLSRLRNHTPTSSPGSMLPFIGDTLSVRLSRDDLVDLLTATSRDSLTLLRAIALFARWVGQQPHPFIVSGEEIEPAVRSGFSLGLTFPLEHIVYLCVIPDRSVGGNFQAHIRVIYKRPYTYRFDEEIFSADVIVRGNVVNYFEAAKRKTGYLVTTEVYVDRTDVQYRNVQGIQGQKRGVSGFFQKMFFFIPKTLYGIHLIDGDLIMDAILNQKIRDFEKLPRYRVIRR